MRCTLPAGELRNILIVASSATPPIPSQPAFGGVLLVVAKDRLTTIGYDGDTSISANTAVTDSVDGQVLVPPRPLSAYLSNVDPNQSVRLEAVSDVEVSVTAGGGTPYRFRRIPAAFPLPTVIKSAVYPTDLSRLASALIAVRPSVPKETPVVQITSGPYGLRLHATDNYRLTRAELPEAGLGSDLSAVVSLAVLERAARNGVTSIQVDPASKSIRFLSEHVAIATRFLSVDFPNVDTIVERKMDNHCVLPTTEVKLALQRLSAIAESSPLNVTLAQDKMTLSVENAELGSGVEEITLASHVDAPFRFAAKLSYLADALGGIGKSDSILSWSNANEAVYLSTEDPLPIICIVMPMRV